MASSDSAQISTIVDLIQIINPKSVLDVGCGFGKYGFLTKEYLMTDVWENSRIVVNAVEGYEPYITELQKLIYNNVFHCNAMDFSKYLDQDYDLVIMIDAFEHLSVKDGRKFISEILKRTKNLLISVPRYVSNQKGLPGDPDLLEAHRAFWTRAMFKKSGNCLIIPNNARKSIALFSGSGSFSPEIIKFRNKKLALKFIPYYLADISNFLKWFINKNNPERYIGKSEF